jgi:hypothetical protein
MFHLPYCVLVHRTTSRSRYDACRLTGAADRANNSRKTVAVKGEVSIAVYRDVEPLNKARLRHAANPFTSGVLPSSNTATREELQSVEENAMAGGIGGCGGGSYREEFAAIGLGLAARQELNLAPLLTREGQ